MIPWTDCEEEDMFYWPLKTRKADIHDRCVMMTQWDDGWAWRKVRLQCECPAFLECAVSRITPDGPSTYRNVSAAGLDELLASPAKFWFARKFPGDGSTVQDNAVVHGVGSLDSVMAKRLAG